MGGNIAPEYASETLKLENVPKISLGWGQEGKRWAAVVGGWESILYVCSKMGGLFLTSVLITLGAPFWKDVMNALAGAKKVIPKTAG